MNINEFLKWHTVQKSEGVSDRVVLENVPGQLGPAMKASLTIVEREVSKKTADSVGQLLLSIYLQGIYAGLGLVLDARSMNKAQRAEFWAEVEKRINEPVSG